MCLAEYVTHSQDCSQFKLQCLQLSNWPSREFINKSKEKLTSIRNLPPNVERNHAIRTLLFGPQISYNYTVLSEVPGLATKGREGLRLMSWSQAGTEFNFWAFRCSKITTLQATLSKLEYHCLSEVRNQCSQIQDTFPGHPPKAECGGSTFKPASAQC